MHPNSPFAARIVFFLIDLSLRAVFLVVLAGLACYLLRRSSAAARSAAWALTLAALLCLPLLRVLMPALPAYALPLAATRPNAWQGAGVGPSTVVRRTISPPSRSPEPAPNKLAALAVPRSPSKNQASLPLASQAIQPRQVPGSESVPSIVSARHRANPLPLFQKAFVMVWFAGICVVLARTVIGLASARLLVNRCRPMTVGQIAELADEARREMGVLIAVRLFAGDSANRVAVPMAGGFLRPVILLPADAGAWSADRLRVVLLHEMAHVRRGDWIVQILARCVCALYWFHPLVWLAAHRLRAEGERACDDLVLSCDIAATDYATHLLQIVHHLPRARHAWTGTVAMARKTEVEERLQAILAGRQNRSVVTRRPLVVSAALVAAVTVSLAALHFAAVQPAVAEGLRREAPSLGSTDATAAPLPAVVAAGAMTQGPFTLMEVTNIDAQTGVTTPSDIDTASQALSFPVTAWGGGTGLWIRIQGGVAFHTLMPILDGQRHTYRYDGKIFTWKGTSDAAFSSGWYGPDGVSRLPEHEQPYTVWGTSKLIKGVDQPILTFVPRLLSRQFRVSTQPLSAAGRPLGPAINLICQPVVPGVLFAQIPSGYSSETKQMSVTASLVGTTAGGASWRLTDLPASSATDSGGLPPAAFVAHGSVRSTGRRHRIGGLERRISRQRGTPASSCWGAVVL